jgi:hypothetical protein
VRDVSELKPGLCRRVGSTAIAQHRAAVKTTAKIDARTERVQRKPRAF